jgi:hypothetical protein
MKRPIHTCPIGRMNEFKPTNPERTAWRMATARWDSDVVYQEWPNRASLAKTIRIQENGTGKTWKACVPLARNEGYGPVVSAPAPRQSLCSVCRDVHGDEIVHPCE